MAAKFDLYQDSGYAIIMLSNYELNFPMLGATEDLLVKTRSATFNGAGGGKPALQ